MEINDLTEDSLIYPDDVLLLSPGQAPAVTATAMVALETPQPETAHSTPTPEVVAEVLWHPGVVNGNLNTAYPFPIELERYTLHVVPDTLPFEDSVVHCGISQQQSQLPGKHIPTPPGRSI